MRRWIGQYEAELQGEAGGQAIDCRTAKNSAAGGRKPYLQKLHELSPVIKLETAD